MTDARHNSAVTDPIVLGVDCGTEGARVVAASPTGEIVGSARRGYPTAFPRPGWAEQAPADWRIAVVEAVRELLAALNPERVAAIGVAATSSTVVFARADGEPVHPALLWMDIRAQAEADAFVGTGDEALAVCPDGVSPEWGPPKALWLQRHKPNSYAQAAVICEGGDWLIHELTGVWTANVPAAVTAWFYDARAGRWPAALLAAAGCDALDRRLPPRVLRIGERAAPLASAVAAELGLAAGIPIVSGGIDSVAAMIGTGVCGPGEAALITGSSNVVLTLAADPIRGHGIWGSYADAAIPGTELVVGLHNAGSALSWLTRELLPAGAEPHELEAAAAAVPAGGGGLIALPDFQGNRTPFTEPRVRGMIWGLSLSHHAAHVFRAMLEGIAFASRHCLESMERAGVAVTSLRACGGATRSPLTMQIYADILGRPVVTAAFPDASALGAAIAAATGAGIHPDLVTAAGRMVRNGARFTPNPAHQGVYDRHYALFKQTYSAMLPLMRAMADEESAR